MGSDGGSSSPPTQQIIDPGRPQNIPLEPQLVSQGENILEAQAPFAQFGAGYQLAPRSPFGQTYVPGLNQTIFGDPYNPQNYANYYGQSAVAQQPAQSQFAGAGGAGGQASQSGGGGAWGGPQHMSQMAQFLAPLFGIPPGANPGQGQQQQPQGQPNNGGQAFQPQYNPPPPRNNTPGTGTPAPQNPPPLTGGPAGPQAAAPPPSGLTAPDPWAGTGNARNQNNPGSNWNPDGSYNPNGPYYQSPGVDANGQPLPATGGAFTAPKGVQ